MSDNYDLKSATPINSTSDPATLETIRRAVEMLNELKVAERHIDDVSLLAEYPGWFNFTSNGVSVLHIHTESLYELVGHERYFEILAYVAPEIRKMAEDQGLPE